MGDPSAPKGDDLRPKRKDLPRNQSGVALAWRHGYRMKSGAMRTDGLTVWSWNMEIGGTNTQGRKVARDLRGCISASTTRHIGEVLRVADESLRECECKCEGDGSDDPSALAEGVHHG